MPGAAQGRFDEAKLNEFAGKVVADPGATLNSALAPLRKTLKSDGMCMIVEPFAGDRGEDDLNPVGRVYYAASTMICTLASKSQEVGIAPGAQAGERRLREVLAEGGFTRFRRVAETPFNAVYEARP